MAKARVEHLILPVAGLGVRLRPLTLKTPKALVEINGKPIIEYSLEEAKEGGIKHIVLVVNPTQKVEFEKYAKNAAKKFGLTFSIRVQDNLFGNGQAILAGGKDVKGRPFVVRFCDDIFVHKDNLVRSLVHFFEKHQAPVIVLERVPWDVIGRYGVVATKPTQNPLLHRVLRIVEKPKQSDFKEKEFPLSNLAVPGAHIWTPRAFDRLSRLSRIIPPINDSLVYTAALQEELDHGGKVYGWEFPGTRLDGGTLHGIAHAEKFFEERNKSIN